MGVKPQTALEPPLSTGPSGQASLSRDPGVDAEAGVRLSVEPVHLEGHREGREKGGDGGSTGTQSDMGRFTSPCRGAPWGGAGSHSSRSYNQTAKFKAQLPTSLAL